MSESLSGGCVMQTLHIDSPLYKPTDKHGICYARKLSKINQDIEDQELRDNLTAREIENY